VIPQADTTIVVPRGWRLRPAAAGSSILERTR